MDEWILLSEKTPDKEQIEVLGCDWYFKEFRAHVCDAEAQDSYWCGELSGLKNLGVKKSICPSIGHGDSAYWMPIPNKSDPRWIKFEKGRFPHKSIFVGDEALIRLHNGGHYVAYINPYDWSPSFNTMSRFGSLESIDCYMEVPAPPPYIKPKELSPEEALIKDEKGKAWLKKQEEDYKKRREENPNGTMRFTRHTPKQQD